MNNSIILQNLTAEELQQLIDSSIKTNLTELQKEVIKKELSEELMTRDETCQFLKIDASTLWSWTNKGKVKAYGIGARRYYKRNELMESLTLLKK